MEPVKAFLFGPPAVPKWPILKQYPAAEYFMARIQPIRFLLVFIILGSWGLVKAFFTQPLIFLDFKKVQEIWFAEPWLIVAPYIDKSAKPIKGPLLSRASGIVLDLGTGSGINLQYYPTGQITKLICVEPNRALHPTLLRNAERAGFTQEKLFLTGESAQADIPGSALSDIPDESVDTVIALSCLCSIPHPQVTIKTLRNKLKPGGKFIFSEHVKSTEKSTIYYQNLVKPVWYTLCGGCDITRPTGDWILNEKWSDTQVKDPPGLSIYEFTPPKFGWVVK